MKFRDNRQLRTRKSCNWHVLQALFRRVAVGSQFLDLVRILESMLQEKAEKSYLSKQKDESTGD